VKYGKPATLLVDAKGFQDGRLVVFEIFKQAEGKKEKIAEVNGVVRREKGVGQWQPSFEREAQLPLQDKIRQQPQKEQYSFIAIMDKDTPGEKKVEGTPIEFLYPVEISVLDVSGKPPKDIKFTITFSDGTSKTGVLRNGYAKIGDAPAGKFNVKLEGYDFVFK
jgi:hypothetical protein